MNDTLYSTTDVVRATGLRYRQLDYWTRRTHSIFPTVDADGSGYQRRWSPDDLNRLHAIAAVHSSFATIGIHQIPASLVHRIWMTPDTVITAGVLTIDLTHGRDE